MSENILYDLELEPYLSISKKLNDVCADNFKLVKYVASMKGIREDVFLGMEKYFIKGTSYFSYVVTLLGEHDASSAWYELLYHIETTKENEVEIGAYIKEIVNLFQQNIPYEVVRNRIEAGVEVYNLQTMCKLDEVENEYPSQEMNSLLDSVVPEDEHEKNTINSGSSLNKDSFSPSNENSSSTELQEKRDKGFEKLYEYLQKVMDEYQQMTLVVDEMEQLIEKQTNIIKTKTEENEQLSKENFELRTNMEIYLKEKEFAEKAYQDLKNKLKNFK